MRIALLANPKSGGETEAGALERRLAAAGATVHAAGDPCDPDPDLGDAERVVVAGGDGSVGPAAEAAVHAGLPLAVIATGTANNFAAALELPVDLDEACALAASGERTRQVELCRMGERPFVNCASAGLAVAAARSAKRWKGTLGPLAYAVGALAAGLRASALGCKVVTDGDVLFHGTAWQVVIAGTGAFGPRANVGETDQDDGLLDVVVLEAGPRLKLMRRAYGLRTGTIKAQDGVHHRRAARVEFTGRASFNVDGEIVGPENGASFSVEPQAVQLICKGVRPLIST